MGLCSWSISAFATECLTSTQDHIILYTPCAVSKRWLWEYFQVCICTNWMDRLWGGGDQHQDKEVLPLAGHCCHQMVGWTCHARSAANPTWPANPHTTLILEWKWKGSRLHQIYHHSPEGGCAPDGELGRAHTLPTHLTRQGHLLIAHPPKKKGKWKLDTSIKKLMLLIQNANVLAPLEANCWNFLLYQSDWILWKYDLTSNSHTCWLWLFYSVTRNFKCS